MSFLPPLPQSLAEDVLQYLDVPSPRHQRDWLDTLVQQYGRHIPWESASRIARIATLPQAQCAQLPEAFWTAALQHGSGGTCFESNAALSALLSTLGFDGALTINDMNDARGCHTALLVKLGAARLVVDVGYPIYAALPLEAGPTSRQSPWFTYDVMPVGAHRYRLENRPHPVPYIFDLVDESVPVDAYVRALRDDYEAGGLFLDRLVMRKVVDGQVWRFNSGEHPWHLQCFVDGTRVAQPMPANVEDAAQRLAAHFGVDEGTVTRALGHVAHA